MNSWIFSVRFREGLLQTFWIAKCIHGDRYLSDKSNTAKQLVNESVSVSSDEEYELVGDIRNRYDWDQWYARSTEQKQWWTNLELSINWRKIWEIKT